IRVGTFANGEEELVEGASFTITSRDVDGTSEIVSTTLPTLAEDVSVGDPLLIDDGRLRLRATEVTATEVVTEVEIGGTISNHKGINLPGVPVSVPALSEKDVEDLKWGLQLGFDWVALSFVRSPEDMDAVRSVMDEVGITAPVIAKLEQPHAVTQLAEVVAARAGAARRDHRRLRRYHGRPRRPRRRTAAGAGPDRAEARRRDLPPAGQTGHRGHPDARDHDRRPAPDPRRGQRLRQCRPRRG